MGNNTLTDFKESLKINPRLFMSFYTQVRLDIRRGRKRGAKAIVEYLRNLNRGFKINNRFTSYYAHMVMAINPKMKDHFRVRKDSPVSWISDNDFNEILIDTIFKNIEFKRAIEQDLINQTVTEFMNMKTEEKAK